MAERQDAAAPGSWESVAELLRSRAYLADRAWPPAGDPGFEPVSRGMRAALPHLDDLVAGDTLERLALLDRGLGGDR